jgi:hypothetical protein
MFGLEKEQHRNGKIPCCVHYPVGWFLNCPSWIKHGPSAPSFAVRFRNQSCVASETDQKPTEAWLRNQKIWFRNHNVWFRNQNFPQRTQNEPFWTRCYICIFGITRDKTIKPATPSEHRVASSASQKIKPATLWKLYFTSWILLFWQLSARALVEGMLYTVAPYPIPPIRGIP